MWVNLIIQNKWIDGIIVLLLELASNKTFNVWVILIIKRGIQKRWFDSIKFLGNDTDVQFSNSFSSSSSCLAPVTGMKQKHMASNECKIICLRPKMECHTIMFAKRIQPASTMKLWHRVK